MPNPIKLHLKKPKQRRRAFLKGNLSSLLGRTFTPLTGLRTDKNVNISGYIPIGKNFAISGYKSKGRHHNEGGIRAHVKIPFKKGGIVMGDSCFKNQHD